MVQFFMPHSVYILRQEVMLRCHVSGVFMSCDYRGIRDDSYLSFYFLSSRHE